MNKKILSLTLASGLIATSLVSVSAQIKEETVQRFGKEKSSIVKQYKANKKGNKLTKEQHEKIKEIKQNGMENGKLTEEAFNELKSYMENELNSDRLNMTYDEYLQKSENNLKNKENRKQYKEKFENITEEQKNQIRQIKEEGSENGKLTEEAFNELKSYMENELNSDRLNMTYDEYEENFENHLKNKRNFKGKKFKSFDEKFKNNCTEQQYETMKQIKEKGLDENGMFSEESFNELNEYMEKEFGKSLMNGISYDEYKQNHEQRLQKTKQHKNNR